MVMMPPGPSRLFCHAHAAPVRAAGIHSHYSLQPASALLPPRGRSPDRKHILADGIRWLWVSTLLCALAPSYQWLLARRRRRLWRVDGRDADGDRRRCGAAAERRGAADGRGDGGIFALSAVAGVPCGLLLAEFRLAGRSCFWHWLALPLLVGWRGGWCRRCAAIWYHHRPRNPWQQMRFMYSQPVHLRALR